MKNLLLTGLIAGLIVLSWHPGNGVHAAAEREPMRVVSVDAIAASAAHRAAVTIDRSSVEQGMLTMDVTYVGGCKVHDFSLQSDGETAVLFHENYGDACKTVVSETLRFDLSSLEGDVLQPPVSVLDLPRS